MHPDRGRSREALAAVLVSTLVICACSGGGPRRGSEEGATEAGAGSLAEVETREVLLLFASSEDDSLQAEPRELPWNPSVEERARTAVLALIEGPHENLLPVLPKDAVLRDLYVTRDGTAVVDFAGGTAGESSRRAIGSAEEVAAIYSIVDTLALNFSEIRRVGFLVDGEEAETLFGHVDTRYPIAPGTAPLHAPLAARLRAILAERGETPVEAAEPEAAAAPPPPAAVPAAPAPAPPEGETAPPGAGTEQPETVPDSAVVATAAR